MAERESQGSTDPLKGNPPISEAGGQDEVDMGTSRRKSKSKKAKQDPRLIVDGE